MKSSLKYLASLSALAIVSSAYAQDTPWTQRDEARGAWQGSQFVYGSGEGAAISQQAYAALTRFVLDEVKKAPKARRSVVLNSTSLFEPAFTACDRREPAVIFDADETLLLNYGEQYAEMVLGVSYTDQLWQDWERQEGAHLKAVPGAKEAVEELRSHGVKVIVITNRDAVAITKKPTDPADFADLTVNALKQAGLGDFHHGDDLFLKEENGDHGSDKDHRRAQVAAKYCVLAMAGDQLGDFSNLFPSTLKERRGIVISPAISKLWGQGWFVLPNPIYGTAVPYPGDVGDVFPADMQWSGSSGTSRSQP